MKLGIQGRLILISCVVLTVCGAVSGVYLESVARGWFSAQREAELFRHARTARELILDLDTLDDPAGLQDLATRVGKSTGARVTLVHQQGHVMADSEFTLNQLPALGDHGARPEVMVALQSGEGQAQRLSAALEVDALYVAVRWTRAEGVGVVRLATPLKELEAVVTTIRGGFVVAGAIAMVIALFMSSLASYYLSGVLEGIVQSAQAKVWSAEPREWLSGASSRSMNTLSTRVEGLLASLAKDRDRVQAVLEGMDNAVLALDADNMVILANSATRSIFHLDEDPTGRPLSEVISAPEIMQLVREEGAEDEGVVEFSLEDPHRVVLTRLTRGPGGAILVVHDLTRLRKLETVRRDFIANVSHELRTPIAVIQANAETLLDGALHEPEQAGRFVEGVLRNARRLSQIISDLLDLTRIESGKYEVEFEEIALRRLVERSCTMLESRALARNITLHVSIPEDALVVADCKALDHILSNYIDNAIKYGPEEGRVTVSTSAGEGTWRVEVADQGAGIDSRHHERLFERFYRVDKGRSRYMGGTGLGLAIVKHLAVAMGGRVGMRSGAQGGSVFWVELPLRDEEGGMLA